MQQCTGCQVSMEDGVGQWWHCRNYYNISGRFCSSCYDKISHDAYGHPTRPNDYMLMLLKLSVPQTVSAH